jgi:segregation and condensation protein A
LTENEEKIEPLDIIMQTANHDVSEAQTPDSISQEPVNILFSPSSVIKKDVWDIDLIQILNLLKKILEKTGKKDLKVAGMAALSSSLIY